MDQVLDDRGKVLRRRNRANTTFACEQDALKQVRVGGRGPLSLPPLSPIVRR